MTDRVKRNFFQPRDFVEAELPEVNRELDRWVAEVAGRRVHGSTGHRPLEVFVAEEQSTLRPLPARSYEPVEWRRARVHPDSHIAFDRRIYPVPWRLIGRDLWVRATPSTVAVYADDERVATHQRGVPVPPEVVDQYVPPERASLRHRSRGYWLERADRLGDEVGILIREIFATEDVLSHLRTVQAIVTHLEQFPPARARAACARARHYGNLTYRGVRDILRHREPCFISIRLPEPIGWSVWPNSVPQAVERIEAHPNDRQHATSNALEQPPAESAQHALRIDV